MLAEILGITLVSEAGGRSKSLKSILVILALQMIYDATTTLYLESFPHLCRKHKSGLPIHQNYYKWKNLL